jgi:tetratricopeptide (TPR) repeat protein
VAILIFSLLVALPSAAPAATPSAAVVAVAPLVTEQPDAAWLGLALADDLESRLLDHAAFDSAKTRQFYPLSVYGWRQVQSAARQVRVNTDALMSATDGRRLARALGATAVFTGSFWMKSASVKLMWRLVGTTESPKHEVEIPLDEIATGMERTYTAIVFELGLHSMGVPMSRSAELPMATLRSYGQALEILRQQSLDPRAKVVLPSERIAEAHYLMSEATTSAPYLARAWIWRAIASAMLGENGRAKEELAQAKDLGAGDSPAMAIGLFYQSSKSGDMNRAIASLGSTLNTHLGFLQGLGYLAEAYLQVGKPNEALQLFTIYEQRVPDNAWVGSMVVESLARLGKADEALAAAKALQKRFPDSLEALRALAARLGDTRRFADARQTIDKTLALFPDNPGVLALLAQVEIDSGNLKQAEEVSRRAIKSVDESRGEPLAGYPHLVLGRCLALAGRQDEAVEAFAAAARLGADPFDLRKLASDPRVAKVLADPRLPFHH